MNATAAALNDPPTKAKGADKVPKPADASAPKMFYVLDTTAVALTGHPQEDAAKGRGARSHEMWVDGIKKIFTFEPGKPLSVPIATAVKFLKHSEFKLTDEGGNILDYQRRPKQPDELGAGEQFNLPDNQTVANYTELTNTALQQRALELPGGELLPDIKNRQALVDFLIKTTGDRRKANAEKKPELGPDDFIPAPEVEG